MDFLTNPVTLIVGVAVVMILWTVALKPHAQNANSSAVSKWLATSIALICGLALATVSFRIMRWLVTLPGSIGGFTGAVGSIIAVFFGWQAVVMLVQAIRDLMDKEADKDAQRAALWVPTLLPAGGAAVWEIVSNPRGIGSGLTAAIIAVISVVQCVRINKEAMGAKTAEHKPRWLWVAAIVSFLVGLMAISPTLFVDDVLADYLSAEVMLGLRIVGGVLGLSLLVAGTVDLLHRGQGGKRTPDKHVRRFGYAGVPLLFVFGAGAIIWLFDHTSSGLDIMQGVLS